MRHLPAARVPAAAALAGSRSLRRRVLFPALVGCLVTLAGCIPQTRTADGRPDGARLYQVYCFNCHGPEGTRGGPEMRLAGAGRRPEGDLRPVIEAGRGAMPAWKYPKGPLHDDDVSAVLAYLRSFPASP